MKFRRDKSEDKPRRKVRKFRFVRKTATAALAVVGLATVAGVVKNKSTRVSS